jgi:hypothetical protein
MQKVTFLDYLPALLLLITVTFFFFFFFFFFFRISSVPQKRKKLRFNASHCLVVVVDTPSSSSNPLFLPSFPVSFLLRGNDSLSCERLQSARARLFFSSHLAG